MASVATAPDRYRSAFESLERQGALQEPAWLLPVRRAAIARFAERGFPTTRDEDWRYTNLATLAALPVRVPDGPAPAEPLAVPAPLVAPGAAVARLVFVDGRYSPRHSRLPSLPAGARLCGLAEAMVSDRELVEQHLARHAAWDDDVFTALSTAFVRDGAFLYLPPEAAVTVPVELLYLATVPGAVTQPRTLVVAGPHSRLAVVERYVGLVDEAYFTNAVSELVVGPGAAVDHQVVQEQRRGAFHVATVHATLARNSGFTTCGAALGGRLARTTLTVRFDGEGGRAALRGLYVADGEQHVDHHVTVDHAVPRCTSEQLYKGVMDGSARAVFNGRIVVRRDAQKTDATQTNKHLLLSDGVEVDSKPQLEIFADDVRCTHGAAEGQLAAEALFYLRSRGLGEDEARALLIYGFAREVIERIAVEPVRDHVDRAVLARLGAGRAARGMS